MEQRALASPGQRIGGWLLDFLLIMVAGAALDQLLFSAWDPYQRATQRAEITKAALANAFVWYYWLFEGIFGRTPGKFVTRTKVTRPDGSAPG